MSRRSSTIPPDYFDALYAADADPWKFASSAYERAKYADTLAALPKPRYAHALEVGCSIGVLTRALAPRCDRLLSIEAAAAPLAEAEGRCADLTHVSFAQMFAPADWPEGVFDLLLLSEVVYYLEADDVGRLAARAAASLAPQADVVLAHWTGETDYPLTGDEAAELLIARLDGVAEVVRQLRRPQYRLDILTRR